MHPYRSPEAASQLRTEDVRWRVRVSWGATALLVLLATRHIARIFVRPDRSATGLQLLDAMRTEAVFDLFFALAIAFATFAFATPRRSDPLHARIMAWGLRALAFAEALLAAAWWHDPSLRFATSGPLDWAASALFVALPALGMWFVAFRHADADLPIAARHSRVIALVIAGSSVAILVPLPLVGVILSLAMFMGLIQTLRLKNALGIAYHEWWLAPGVRPAWASLIESRLKLVDVILPDGENLTFADRAEAENWMLESGYVAADVARRENRVFDAPPSPL